ncbi:MAG: cytidylate kinase family protein [Bacteroidales bacterium]|nr:cytidylate kinase family protein [Bacteroidales bacterium]
MSKFFHINIGRQIGSGGLLVANRLGEIFNVQVYDKQLINMSAKESGWDASLFENKMRKTLLPLTTVSAFPLLLRQLQADLGAICSLLPISLRFRVTS